MIQYLNNIEEKCKKNNICFIGFDTEDGKYKNNKTKLVLKCNKCGHIWNTTSYEKFISRPSKCQICNKKYHHSKEEYINLIKSKCIKLNYTFLGFLDDNVTRKTKLKLQCNECGQIWNTTTINNFLCEDRKSHKCGKKNLLNEPSFLKEEKVICNINKKITNSNLEFIGFKEGKYIGRTKSHIILKCNICNSIFDMSLQYFLNKTQIHCKKCQFNRKLSNVDAIQTINEKCKIIGYKFLGFNNELNRYDGKNTKLILKCNKCGRIWKSTKYYNFVNKTIKCTECLKTWKLEKEVEYILNKNNIPFEEQKTFEWLTYNHKLFLDFFLPKHNMFIECQGRQHFMPVKAFGGEKEFSLTAKRDKTKREKCLNMGIRPIYYSTKKWNTFLNEEITHNEEELINKIKNG